MTHEELLEKLLISDETRLYETLTIWQKALYAIVELHQPDPYSNKVIYCAECECLYPCPTIRAIKVELA